MDVPERCIPITMYGGENKWLINIVQNSHRVAKYLPGKYSFGDPANAHRVVANTASNRWLM